MQLDYAKDEVLRKIGRNMLLYQQLEQLLKFLTANGQFSGYASEIWKNKVKEEEKIKKETMGKLVGRFIENTYAETQEAAEETSELKEPYISFSFRVECDAVYYEEKKEVLAKVVAERNDLIHHLLPIFNHNSIDSCLLTSKYLDQQRDKLLPEINAIKRMIESLQKGKKKLAEFINSEEGEKEFRLSWIRQSRLVILLGDIAKQVARADGWTLLSIAGQLIRQHAPKEMADFKKRYSCKSLKGLVLAAEIFDVFEESVDKGGIRVLYRLKDGWELQNA